MWWYSEGAGARVLLVPAASFIELALNCYSVLLYHLNLHIVIYTPARGHIPPGAW